MVMRNTLLSWPEAARAVKRMPRRVTWQFIWLRVMEAWSLLMAAKPSVWTADALSVLTDEKYFGGSSDDLQQARSFNQIPILRKDFVIDEYQILEAKAIGADVILLIAECLEAAQVAHLAAFAHNLGLEVLLEVHSEAQLEKVTAHTHLVGVNNRDLTTFQVDFNRSCELAPKIPADKVKVAESGINDPAAIVILKAAGFQGFLIGEHFMKQEDPARAFENFAETLNNLQLKQ